MKFEHILFDFDGTLIDSAPCILSCYEQVLSEFKVTPSIPVTSSIIGPPLPATVAMLANTNDKTLVNQMVSRFKECYDQRVATETPMYDNVAKVLESLKNSGYRLYIATNKRYVPTMAVIEHLALAEFFTTIGAVDQLPAGSQKKSLLIQAIMQEHDIQPQNALFIGDKLDDFEAADFNSMPFAAAGWGYGDWQAPYTILSNPEEIISFINGKDD